MTKRRAMDVQLMCPSRDAGQRESCDWQFFIVVQVLSTDNVIMGQTRLWGLQQFFADDESLRAQFDAVDALDKQQVIAYCGGAIAASNTVFALTRLGVDGVRLYDGSLTEWTDDPNLPMETG